MCPIRRLFLVVASCLISLSSAWAVPALELVNQVNSTTYTGFLNDALYTHTGDNRLSGLRIGGPDAPQPAWMLLL